MAGFPAQVADDGARCDALLALGADALLRDGTGATALVRAAEKGASRAVAALTRPGRPDLARQLALATHRHEHPLYAAALKGHVAVAEALLRADQRCLAATVAAVLTACGARVARRRFSPAVPPRPNVPRRRRRDRAPNSGGAATEQPAAAAPRPNSPRRRRDARARRRDDAAPSRRRADRDGFTALHAAVVGRRRRVLSHAVEWLREDDDRASAKKALDARNKYGSCALHLAARAGDPVLTRTLLDAGAALDVLDERGANPVDVCLEHARRTRASGAATLEVLEKAGGRPTARGARTRRRRGARPRA